jgi:hypothetical protein
MDDRQIGEYGEDVVGVVGYRPGNIAQVGEIGN